MTPGNSIQPGAGAAQSYGGGAARPGAPANLGDILERVLDKGIVIAGDIQVNLLDIELLTIKLRLVIASLDTAREVGINWWENDPWLSADASRRREGRALRAGGRDLETENRQLAERVRELEAAQDDGGDRGDRGAVRERRRTGGKRHD